MTMHNEHLLVRPSWDCAACDRPWPCDSAREQLRAEFATFPSVLRIYLAGQLADANAELVGANPIELYHRFLGWTRQSLSSPPTSE